MKKPDYLSIEFPRGKSTLPPAVRKYFKHLENKVLKINFSQQRYRKVFEYKVESAELEKEWWPKREEILRLKIRKIEQIKDEK